MKTHLVATDRSDVAIIGGGVIGLSVARELRRAGVERVSIFEKEGSLGQGSSPRANGGVRAQFTTPINIAFSRYSIDELERLQGDYAEELSFHQVGYLLLTGDADRAESLRGAVDLQRSLGVATHWLTREEIGDRAPLLRADGLIAGTFHARDGYLDPSGLLHVLEHEVRRLGAEIHTGCEVGSVDLVGDGFELILGDRRHGTRWLVNAAGVGARSVASLLDVDVPVDPVRRNLAYLHDPDAPKTAQPMCVDLDTGVLVRPEGSAGYLIAYSDPTDPPGWDTSLDPRFLPAVATRIGNRFPHLEGKPIHPKHCWAGLYPETPDGHAIVGATKQVPGFIQCVGFGGHGLMHSPAAGRAVAELITESGSSFDIRPLRPSRFEEGDLVVEASVL